MGALQLVEPQLTNNDRTLFERILDNTQQIVWFEFNSQPVCLASDLVRLKGKSPNDFTSKYLKSLTHDETRLRSLGVFKIEGADYVSTMRRNIAADVGDAEANTLIKPRTSCIYILNWRGAYDYLTYGTDKTAQTYKQLGSESITNVVETTVNKPPTALDALNGIVAALNEQQASIDDLESKYAELEQEISIQRTTLSDLQHKASFISIAQLGINNNTVFTPLVSRLLGAACKQYCQLNNIDYNYHHKTRANEYPQHVISTVFRDGVDRGVYKFKKENGTVYAWSASEPGPFAKQPSKKTNSYKGVWITSKMIVDLVPQFLKGYNSIEKKAYTKYNIWSSLLHPKIEELTGLKIADLKHFGVSTMKPLEVQCKLPALYEWMLPYIQKGQELAKQREEAMAIRDSAAHIKRLKAADARRREERLKSS